MKWHLKTKFPESSVNGSEQGLPLGLEGPSKVIWYPSIVAPFPPDLRDPKYIPKTHNEKKNVNGLS